MRDEGVEIKGARWNDAETLLMFLLLKEEPYSKGFSSEVFNHLASKLELFDISQKTDSQISSKIKHHQSCLHKFSTMIKE